jgi:uncharacterized glyoxalase superfamily protein PhnB
MPKLTAHAPILLVTDVVKSANYFRDCVGFSYDRLWGEPPCFCILHRDGLQLMLSQAPAGEKLRPHWQIVHQMWNVYFWVDDARAMYEELKGRGAKIDYTLGMKPYGCLEFGIQDLDGHDIAIGQIM